MRLLSVLCLAAVVSAACGGGASPKPAAGGGASTSQGSAAAGGSAEFGVPECDRYMNKYVACIESKVPQASRAMMMQQLEQSKAAWKQAASTPQGKASLAQGCAQAEAAAKQALSAYGCSW
jgi:hypothetical protein